MLDDWCGLSSGERQYRGKAVVHMKSMCGMLQATRENRVNPACLDELLRDEVVGQEHVLLDHAVAVPDRVLAEALGVAVRVEAEAQLAPLKRQRTTLAEAARPARHGHLP
jgi:hypothetical protein